MEVIAGVILIAFVGWYYFFLRDTQSKHEDPTDQTVVDYDQLAGLCRLVPEGVYVVFTIRQSGYEHQERRAFASANEAIAAGVSTFKRSGIPYVRIRQNTAERFEFSRPFHDHRGRAEGKKVGSIEIVRVDP